jgi:hypothetical protein
VLSNITDKLSGSEQPDQYGPPESVAGWGACRESGKAAAQQTIGEQTGTAMIPVSATRRLPASLIKFVSLPWSDTICLSARKCFSSLETAGVWLNIVSRVLAEGNTTALGGNAEHGRELNHRRSGLPIRFGRVFRMTCHHSD